MEADHQTQPATHGFLGTFVYRILRDGSASPTLSIQGRELNVYGPQRSGEPR